MRIQIKMGNVEEEKIEEVKIKVGGGGADPAPNRLGARRPKRSLNGRDASKTHLGEAPSEAKPSEVSFAVLCDGTGRQGADRGDSFLAGGFVCSSP
jgi:hypothetical protein